MNHTQTHSDGVSIIGNRKVYPEQSHGFGSTGFGKLGFGSPKWARATTFHPYYVKPGKKLGEVVDCGKPGNRLPIVPQLHESLVLCPGAGGQFVSNPGTKFDHDSHAVKVAQTTQEIQSRLSKAFGKVRRRKVSQIALKPKETAKEAKLELKDIPVNPDYKMKIPAYLMTEEVRKEESLVPRSKVEKTEPVTWTKPSAGGRAGRIERWGE